MSGDDRRPEAEGRRGGPLVCLIVAAAENGVIGRNGELPWRLSADLAQFKRLTMGRSLVMGRKTFESVGRPLPGRKSIVLTRDVSWRSGFEDVVIAHDLDAAIASGAGADRVFIIGGGQVYRLALPLTDRVYLTRVHATVDGDATFPELDSDEWRLTESVDRPADERNEHAFTFQTWDRRAQ